MMSPLPEEPSDPAEPIDDWGYAEDPSAPTTVDGKLTQMGQDLRKLSRASLLATLLVASVLFIVELVAGQGFAHTCGIAIGGCLATLNLWILAGGYFALIDERATALRLALAATGSLVVLLGAALFIVASHRDWMLGFALGLAVPALGGILYAVQKNREED